MTELSQHSKDKLATLHPDLQKVINSVVDKSPWQLVIMQGARTADEQMGIWLSCHHIDGTPNGQPWRSNCNGYPKGTTAPNGAHGTGESNHQGGHAADIGVEIDGAMVWDLTYYQQLAGYISAASDELSIPTVWGGTFSHPDPDHFELDSNTYPV